VTTVDGVTTSTEAEKVTGGGPHVTGRGDVEVSASAQFTRIICPFPLTAGLYPLVEKTMFVSFAYVLLVHERKKRRGEERREKERDWGESE
jgi:hypothetical protein